RPKAGLCLGEARRRAGLRQDGRCGSAITRTASVNSRTASSRASVLLARDSMAARVPVVERTRSVCSGGRINAVTLFERVSASSDMLHLHDSAPASILAL